MVDLRADKETVEALLGPTLDLLRDLIDQGFTWYDFLASTDAERPLMMALAQCIGEHAYSVKQYEAHTDSEELTLYALYVDFLRPLVGQKLASQEVTVDAKLAKELNIHEALLASELKLYREEIVSFAETLIAGDVYTLRDNLEFCCQKLRHADRVDETLKTPMQPGERVEIYNALRRSIVQVENKRQVAFIEEPDYSTTRQWLEDLDLFKEHQNNTLDIESLRKTLEDMKRQAAYRSEWATIDSFLEDLAFLKAGGAPEELSQRQLDRLESQRLHYGTLLENCVDLVRTVDAKRNEMRERVAQQLLKMGVVTEAIEATSD